MNTCPNCGFDLTVKVPPEPPIGTIVTDRDGYVVIRAKNGLWAAPGMYPAASWEPMWHAHGPLTVVDQ